MKPLWLTAAVALGVFAMQSPAFAGASTAGPPGRIHGIIIRHCHYRYHRCHHHGGVIGVPVHGAPIRPPGTGPAHGGIVNGIPPEQRR